ncbi:Ca-activated chloride channel family protein [Evansella caseinilytica]|uniref:Ca-activated chloride channel family protein n=1 Tax=Evansella caseinilytica TaxID=1503961 RepID=A0A1H3UVQ4_9BACI|nr:VWA domain-containing protein [Evansella caseinilytica]SDZ66326.1 Ca-activated chloride channel family protein [Evansella caseinilytica]
MSKGTLRQLLLLTDGCSNSGEDPVAIAALAKEEGVTVNVIGIVNDGEMSEHGITEVEAIAKSGGGISQIVYARQLSQTVQMVTRKAMTQTIHGVVNREIAQILGEEKEMEDLEPEKRGQLMEVVDELGETLDLEVFILVDTSASMKNKLPMVQEALVDLSVSLRSRTGNNEFALYSFPGKRSDIEKLISWTPHFDSLAGAFKKMSTSGVTPTGPAIQEALRFIRNRMKKRGTDEDERFDLEEAGM